MSFYNNIISNFEVYPHRIETNLLQLFVHPTNSEGFSIIYVDIFKFSIAAKQAYLITIFCFFVIFHSSQLY